MNTMNAQSYISDFDSNRQTLSSAAPSQAAPPVDWSNMLKSEHFVQFYEQDSCLIQSIAAFIDAGLQQDQAAIVIATNAHCEAIRRQLLANAVDLSRAQADGRLFVLDAA